MFVRPQIFVVLPALTLAASLAAQDWPAYHGPNGDRSVVAKLPALDWAEKAPQERWRTKTKAGFSSFTVAGSRAFTLVTRDGGECCVALDVKNGEELWATDLGSKKYDRGGGAGTRDNRGGDGPRCTPTHDGKHVYVFDAALVVHCLDEKSGKHVWKKDLVEEYGAKNIRWQNAAAPLVEGDAVFVAGGGEDQSLLAFDKKSGELIWKGESDGITHATPIAATIHGVRQVIYFTQAGLVAVQPKDGKVLWRQEYPFRVSTAASPVVWKDIVFCSAGYGVGAGAFRISKGEDGFASELLWRKRNKLINHWSTPVCKDGHLYGMFSFKKYGKGPLQCIELETGDIKWSQAGFGPGNAIVVGEHVVALSDRGEVVVAAATPEEYREVARADVLDGKCWSSPAYAKGQLFVRSTVEAVCLDLRKQSGEK